MKSLICSYEARSWTKFIAWIQIVLFSLGILLEGGGLMVLLVAGKDAVDKVALENPDQGNFYLKLVVNYAMSVIFLVLGIILAVFLIKGASESKSRYLKWWLIYCIVCLAWFVLSEIIVGSVDKILLAFLQISVFSSVYGFCIFVVITLIKEIEAVEELKKGQIDGSGFRIGKPLASKSKKRLLSSPPRPVNL